MDSETSRHGGQPRTGTTATEGGFRRPAIVAATLLAVAGIAAGCSDDEVAASNLPDDGTGGVSAAGSGGQPGTGGTPATGGMPSTGGAGGGDTGGAGGGGTGGSAEFDGQEVFRHDTFGDEKHWTDTLRMHEVIQSAVDPTTALSVGLKVDVDKVPAEVLESPDLPEMLTQPSTTVALIGFDAVLGIKGTVDDQGNLVRMGVTCALCHSTVDDSVMPGIGHRIDGPANRDLDPGKIISLSPAMQDPAVQAVLLSWGPGYFDPRWNQDQINHPVLIPPIYGLEGVALETYTGDGPISYWNNYVAVTQMGGQGSFSDDRLGIDIRQSPDLVRPKLPALFEYQVSIPAPTPPAGSFDAAAAARGKMLFEGAATCSSCHSGAKFTDAPTLHEPEETGMEPLTAQRSATKKYRTTPLRALWQHAPYFHDGSAATLPAVVDHYNRELALELTDAQRIDLVEYLKSL